MTQTDKFFDGCHTIEEKSYIYFKRTNCFYWIFSRISASENQRKIWCGRVTLIEQFFDGRLMIITSDYVLFSFPCRHLWFLFKKIFVLKSDCLQLLFAAAICITKIIMQLDRKQIYVQGAFFRLFQHQPIASERILWLTNNSEIFLKNIQQCKDLSTKQRTPN